MLVYILQYEEIIKKMNTWVDKNDVLHYNKVNRGMHWIWFKRYILSKLVYNITRYLNKLEGVL